MASSRSAGHSCLYIKKNTDKYIEELTDRHLMHSFKYYVIGLLQRTHRVQTNSLYAEIFYFYLLDFKSCAKNKYPVEKNKK